MCKFNDPIAVPPSPMRQPLYPYTVSPVATRDCLFTIAPHSGHVFPFWLCPGKTVLVNVMHTGRVQDRSLSAWVSSFPMGQSVISQPASTAEWNPSRTNRMIIAVYDRDATPDAPTELLIPTVPGPLYLNVLNLINSSNEYVLRLTECGCTDTP